MSRKEIPVTIGDDGGRDKNKTFIIREMSAEQAQNWIIKATCAAKAADPSFDIDFSKPSEDLFNSIMGAFFKGSPFAIIALLDELMTCIKLQYDPSKPPSVLAPSTIEEIFTRVHLQREAFQLCTGFSLPGSPSK